MLSLHLEAANEATVADAADVPDTDTVADTSNTNSNSVADRSHVPHVSNVLGVVSLALGMMMVGFCLFVQIISENDLPTL